MRKLPLSPAKSRICVRHAVEDRELFIGERFIEIYQFTVSKRSDRFGCKGFNNEGFWNSKDLIVRAAPHYLFDYLWRHHRGKYTIHVGMGTREKRKRDGTLQKIPNTAFWAVLEFPDEDEWGLFWMGYDGKFKG